MLKKHPIELVVILFVIAILSTMSAPESKAQAKLPIEFKTCKITIDGQEEKTPCFKIIPILHIESTSGFNLYSGESKLETVDCAVVWGAENAAPISSNRCLLQIYNTGQRVFLGFVV